MQLAELKPILTTLVLPPAGPLLLAALGWLLVLRRRRSGHLLIVSALAALWLLSCNAVAIGLAAHLLPQSQPLAPATTAATLQARQTQAIVVLGSGILPQAPEYGQAQPTADAAARLRYGAWLARQSRLPLAFAGGIGWAAQGEAMPSEGEVSRHFVSGDYGIELRWVDDQSRDTSENARQMFELLSKAGVTRIALVTSSWHMPRSVLAFERAGFAVLPAPTAFAVAQQRPLLEWLPSLHGLLGSQRVLREWLGLWVARL
ncbi:hypothetical protein RD110_14320 [Rhodoferax koreense]|uniref:DUF218 domain-containing protein n=1 Tax=Rhodoferax koreensis TaxID=1842727 RepID=A0A1P8JWU3_9BURK|nr:YdcF family protein [Rhodoferax koreense]APW38229.1 hypothetical protein RD110_14320 [Rhodoferax koreense]